MGQAVARCAERGCVFPGGPGGFCGHHAQMFGASRKAPGRNGKELREQGIIPAVVTNCDVLVPRQGTCSIDVGDGKCKHIPKYGSLCGIHQRQLRAHLWELLQPEHSRCRFCGVEMRGDQTQELSMEDCAVKLAGGKVTRTQEVTVTARETTKVEVAPSPAPPAASAETIAVELAIPAVVVEVTPAAQRCLADAEKELLEVAVQAYTIDSDFDREWEACFEKCSDLAEEVKLRREATAEQERVLELVDWEHPLDPMGDYERLMADAIYRARVLGRTEGEQAEKKRHAK